MHCPNCGHRQASAELKFCSRCGFQTDLIRDIVKGGGTQVEEFDAPKFWVRRNGVFVSFVLIMVSIIAAVLFEKLGVQALGELVAVFGFCVGAIGIIASNLYLRKSSNTNRGALPNTNTQQLSPQQSIPVDDYVRPGGWKALDTNDLAQPQSVTDNTTKLLENNK